MSGANHKDISSFSSLETSGYPDSHNWKGDPFVINPDDGTTLYIGDPGYGNFYRAGESFYQSPMIDRMSREIRKSKDAETFNEECDDWRIVVKAAGDYAVEKDYEALMWEDDIIPVKTIQFPTRFENCVDILFSHNEVIALWYEDDDHEYVRIFTGAAWSVPPRYRRLFVLQVISLIPAAIQHGDTINLLVHACDKTPKDLPKWQHSPDAIEQSTDNG